MERMIDRRKRYAFPKSERCDYCKSIEVQLEQTKRTVQWLNSLQSSVLRNYIAYKEQKSVEFQKQLSKCGFPFCKGCDRKKKVGDNE